MLSHWYRIRCFIYLLKDLTHVLHRPFESATLCGRSIVAGASLLSTRIVSEEIA